MLAARHEDNDATDAALRAGLRRIGSWALPSYDPAHTAQGRRWFLAVRALSVGAPLEVVAIAPELVERVAFVLAHPDGELVIERLARWCERGGCDA